MIQISTESTINFGRIFLAPVAGFTDKVFRGICVEQGADFTFTELVSSEALFRNSSKTQPLLERAANERSYAIQLFGADPAVMANAAKKVLDYAPALIDINAGCPVPKVVKSGAGSALMKTPGLFARVISAVVKAAQPVPVSVKIRSGWDAASINYLECGKIAQDNGASLVTLHPRTRSQGYGGVSDWRQIKALSSALDIPVCGSGDLFSAESALKMLRETNCRAVMFARGALGNPFIFAETKALIENKPWTPPPDKTKIDTALRHLKSLAEIMGEESACRAMRAHFCRYIKGLPNSAAIRDKIVRAKTIGEYTACSLSAVSQAAAFQA